MLGLLSKLQSIIIKKKRERYINSLINRGMKIGRNVEIIADFFFDPSHCFLITIGDNCTICPNVRLIAHDASTKKFLGYTKIGKITIGDNCFLGDSVLVLPNVNIGSHSIIGSGAIVTRDIPPYTVSVGNPAKTLCTLDEYLSRINTICNHTKIFDKSYFIENLDEKKLTEILDTTNEGLGFIV